MCHSAEWPPVEAEEIMTPKMCLHSTAIRNDKDSSEKEYTTMDMTTRNIKIQEYWQIHIYYYYTDRKFKYGKKKLYHGVLTLSGKVSKDVLTGSLQPNLEDLKRLIMSCSVAATTKYSCFRRSSFPSKNYDSKNKMLLP